MINIVGIIVLLVIYSSLFIAIIKYYKNKLNSKEIEILQRDKELGFRTQIIKNKNLLIKEKEKQIEELEDEIKEFERKNNKRLRQNSKICN